MRRRTLQPRSPPSYIGVRMPRRRRRGYHAGKSPEDAKELHHESLQQNMRCGAMHVSRDHLAAGPADRSVPSTVFVDVVARRLGPQVVQPSLRLVFIFGRASV